VSHDRNIYCARNLPAMYSVTTADERHKKARGKLNYKLTPSVEKNSTGIQQQKGKKVSP